MKKFSKPVKLSCWQTLIDRYANLSENLGKKRSEYLDEEEMKYIESVVATDLKNFSGLTHTVRNAMIFYSPPNDDRGLHIDYFKDWINYPTWALNVPILNGELCEMQWYGGDYDKKIDAPAGGSTSYHLTWKSPPELLETAMIDVPTAVYVDIPHTVINRSDKPRVVLSIRFRPSLSQDHK